MARVKITKKDLKQDELRNLGHRIYNWFLENQKTIIIVLVAVLAILVIGKLYSLQRRNIRREANVIFSEAVDYFQMGINDTENSAEHFDACINNCRRIREDYGSSPLAPNALHMEATAAFFKANTAEDYDKAVSLYNQYIDRVSSDYEKAVGYVGLGYSYENKYFMTDNMDILPQAVDAYEKAIQLGGDRAIAAEGRIGKARLLELQRKDEEALLLYESVKERRKDIQPRFAEAEDEDEEERQFSNPQLGFMNRQLQNMKELFTYSQTADFAIERLKGME